MDDKKDTYIEPFFGGGSIGLEVFKSGIIGKICINDKDIGVASLWTAIIKHPKELKGLIMAFKPSTSHFYEFKEYLTGLSSISYDSAFITDCGFKKLAIHQISYSGLGTMSGGPLGGKDQRSDYKIDCRWSPKYICKEVDQLHALFSRMDINGGICHCRDFSEILANNKKNFVYYLDPPYYVKGNELYQYSFTEYDHKRLANLVEELDGEWLLSYDDCEEIRKLYDWASIEMLDVKYSISGATKKPELLIYDN